MSIVLEVKAQLTGKRKIKFEKLKAQKEAQTAALLREILDFYFDNHS